MVLDDDRYVVGVDYGTLSGRAVVVRVSDGAELGTAVHDYPHAVLERHSRDLAGPGRRCRRTGRCRCPRTTSRCCASPCPAAVAAAGIDPAQVIGIATDFTACTMVPTLADGTPLCERRRACADRPHAYVKLWKHHAAQAQADRINELARERGEPWLAALRRADLLGVGVRQGAAAARGGPRALRPRWSTGSRPPTGSSGSCAAPTSATPAPPATRASARTARYPSPRVPRRAQPGVRATSSTTSSSTRSAQLGDRGRRAHRRGRRLDRAARGHRVAVGNVDAHVTAPAAQAVGARPDGRDHGHLDLPRHERRRAARGAGHVRRRRRRHRRRPLGLRGRPERCRRHLRLVRRAPVPAAYDRGGRGGRASACTSTSPRLAAEQAVGEHGLVALDWHSGNRSVLVDHELSGLVVGLTLATRAGGRLPRAARGDRLRHPRDRRDVPRQPGCRSTEFIVAGGLAEERAADADLRRRDPAAAVGHRLRAGPGARLGDPRRGRRRRLPRRAGRGQGDGQGASRHVFTARRGRAPPTTSSSQQYRALHDHFGRGASDACARLKAIRAGGPRVTAMTARRGRRARHRRPRCAPRSRAPARRAHPLPAGRLDRRQRLRPGARQRPAWSSSPAGVSYDDLDAGEHGRLRPRRPASSRASARRPRTPRRTPTSTAHMPAGRRRRAHPLDLRHRVGGPRRADPVRADHGAPTSSAARSRSGRSRSSATTRSAAASSRRCARAASPGRADGATTASSPSGATPATRSRPP